MKITNDILSNNGFEYLDKQSELLRKYQKEQYGIENYSVFRLNTNDDYPLKLDIDNGFNNRGSEWHLHIDNDHCETIGSADIDTVHEFNLLMEVFGSKFRL